MDLPRSPMERLFPSFMRVLRDLDDADVLLTTFQEFESNPSATSAEDRIRFLDFPAATTLSKQKLLKKAAQSPQELTSSEVELLYNRYWGRISFREESIRSDCFDNLKLECLESFRTSFHAEYEADALKNAEAESSRRYDEMREAQDKADLAHIFEHGYPWLRQLWQEDEGKRPWGYAIFESPQWILENPEHQETYDLKQTNLFHWAHAAIGSGIQIGSQWYLESLDLPFGTGRDKSFMAIMH